MGLMLDHHANNPAKPLPQPEDVFVAWLLALPRGLDLAAATDAEILRLRRYAGSHQGPARLLDLFKGLRQSLGSAVDGPRLQ